MNISQENWDNTGKNEAEMNNSSRGIQTVLFIFRENFLTITKRKSTSEDIWYADVIIFKNFKK